MTTSLILVLGPKEIIQRLKDWQTFFETSSSSEFFIFLEIAFLTIKVLKTFL